MQIKHTIFILLLFAFLSSCEDADNDYQHYRANFLSYVIPDAFDTIVAKKLDAVEIEKTIEQIISMTENADYDVYGYAFTGKVSHLDNKQIELKENENLYKAFYEDIDFKYNDSHGLFSTKKRHHQGGMAKNVDSSEKVHYIFLKQHFYGGTIIDFVIYFKGRENGNFTEKFKEDKKRRKDENVSYEIYHFDWSKVFNEVK